MPKAYKFSDRNLYSIKLQWTPTKKLDLVGYTHVGYLFYPYKVRS